MTISKNTPRITCKGILADLMQAVETYTGRSWIDQIAMRVTSTQEFEEYAWLGGTPGFREWIGARLAQGLRENSMTIRNKKFESTMLIQADWIRRQKANQVSAKIDEHARAVVGHDATNLSTFLVNGTGSTSGLCYDGQYFFDTDHSTGQSGSQKNLLTSSEVAALNVSSTTEPTPYELVKAILGMIAYMLKYKDDTGVINVNSDARKWLVMIPAWLIPYMVPAFGGLVINTGSGGVDNPLVIANKVIDGMDISLAVNPLTDDSWTASFAVFRTDLKVKPLIIQEEVDLEYTVWDESSDWYKDNDSYKYGMKRICNWGYGLWQYAALGTLS